MKKYFYLLGFAAGGGIMAKGGLVVGGFIILLMLMILIVVWPYVETKIIVYSYKGRKESLFIFGCHPVTGQEPNMGELEEFCLFVPHNQVMMEKEKHQQYFQMSGNESYCDPSLSGYEKINVYTGLFQDGDRINEIWSEYEDFCRDTVRVERSSRHKLLKEEDSEYYDKYFNNQKGVIWEIPSVDNKE